MTNQVHNTPRRPYPKPVRRAPSTVLVALSTLLVICSLPSGPEATIPAPLVPRTIRCRRVKTNAPLPTNSAVKRELALRHHALRFTRAPNSVHEFRRMIVSRWTGHYFVGANWRAVPPCVWKSH